ncbi:MAG: hypothetical protein JO033_06590 [Acidobacteriaceae bacterium]|nr:hypothetical protein [Acidobacteriaceae bacterium]MBV9501631.1 hypothetical protein [Acidobacteriaceae bacterium]
MIKTLAKQLPHPILLRVYHAHYLRQQRALAVNLASITNLPLLEILRLSPLKTSDTVFILGSGWSINEIPAQRWKTMAMHDTIGFNFWPVHPFVPRIFVFENLCAGMQQDLYRAFYATIARRSEEYRETVKIATEPHPQSERQLLHELPRAFRENLYVGYTAPVTARSNAELESGMRYLLSTGVLQPGDQVRWLFKYGGSVVAMLSLAVRMNYKRIVLCGIDLGKQDYFYHLRERYPESADWEFAPRKDIHLTARRLPWMVPAQEVIWAFEKVVLRPAGIELFVENRSSTLYPQVAEAPPSLWQVRTTKIG